MRGSVLEIDCRGGDLTVHRLTVENTDGRAVRVIGSVAQPQRLPNGSAEIDYHGKPMHIEVGGPIRLALG